VQLRAGFRHDEIFGPSSGDADRSVTSDNGELEAAAWSW
jgi:hypothetical protein